MIALDSLHRRRWPVSMRTPVDSRLHLMRSPPCSGRVMSGDNPHRTSDPNLWASLQLLPQQFKGLRQGGFRCVTHYWVMVSTCLPLWFSCTLPSLCASKCPPSLQPLDEMALKMRLEGTIWESGRCVSTCRGLLAPSPLTPLCGLCSSIGLVHVIFPSCSSMWHGCG